MQVATVLAPSHARICKCSAPFSLDPLCASLCMVAAAAVRAATHTLHLFLFNSRSWWQDEKRIAVESGEWEAGWPSRAALAFTSRGDDTAQNLHRHTAPLHYVVGRLSPFYIDRMWRRDGEMAVWCVRPVHACLVSTFYDIRVMPTHHTDRQQTLLEWSGVSCQRTIPIGSKRFSSGRACHANAPYRSAANASRVVNESFTACKSLTVYRLFFVYALTAPNQHSLELSSADSLTSPLPPLCASAIDLHSCDRAVYFGPYTSNGAQTMGVGQGGAISSIFDSVTAQLAFLHARERLATAELKVRMMRPVVPVPGVFRVVVWVIRDEGDRVYLRAELSSGAAGSKPMASCDATMARPKRKAKL
jgi:acyl-coenzyme A thioesterase PaaI-like protein